ncbi:MAG: phosphate ABC transporter substrate-binding protein PstS, partial [Syntrophobacteraceae bacterium]|nr:phosphate ABC transporter substrate-binding protein PstS [Syntrophobacteraceae bacterium]
TQTQPRDVEIIGAGATFPYPLYKNWIQVYQNAHAKVGVSYEAVGSGEGVRRFLKQEVDFGASDAAMSDEEMAQVDRGVRLIPATAGIIVVAYNLKGVNGVLKLPREVYVGIFSGEIRKWDDARIKKANPGSNPPARDIILVTRADGSGTTYAFTNHLSAVNKSWRDQGPGVGKVVKWPANSMAARGNEGVAGRIKITDGAVGYVEYGYAQRAGLAMAALENKSGNFIEPSPGRGQATLTNTQNEMPENRRMFFPDPPGEDSYPIVTYSWILLYGTYPNQKKAEALKDFVKWGITDGQKFSEGLGFCSLPDHIRQLGAEDIEKIK